MNAPASIPGPVYHDALTQGSEEWLAARCGMITASEMKLILTSRLNVADNDKTRAHVFELLAQRITKYVEPHYISDDMLRGQEDEFFARQLYAENYAPVTECGFITNSKWGFTLGYSPDALVGDDGLIECKSRRQKYQVQTLCCNAVPDDYLLQLQTGLLVSERQWIDFLSYSGGLPMCVIRVEPDPVVQDAILTAAEAFEAKLAAKWDEFNATLATTRCIPTERREAMEIIL